MDDRIVQFIDALRGAGVRVSVAESIDALQAIAATGVADKDLFRLAMQATLVKEAHDIPEFTRLFPSFFGTGAPPMPNQPGSGMSEEDREKLADMLEEMLQNMSPEQLRQLFESMMSGQNMSSEDMQQLLSESTSMGMGSNPSHQGWMTRQAMRDLEFDRLDELLQELMEKLRAAGVSEEALGELMEQARQNQSALAEQIGQEVGAAMMQQEREERRQQPPIDELMDRQFDRLRGDEIDDLRGIVNRLASLLRSRAALRQRRGNKGTLDAKSTIRANMRFGGVPLDVRHKKRHLKPKLTVICDLSTSMRPIVAFMLLLVYALQDQVSRTRSYAFVGDLHDISNDFNEARPEAAIEAVQDRIRPGHYNTDLGKSLATFARDQLGTIDHRTTVIILGDGRNNHYDPNLRDFEAIKRRARKVVWFNPEHPRQWGTGDSDMLQYVPLCDAVHHVSNLRQLVDAVDSLFTRR